MRKTPTPTKQRKEIEAAKLLSKAALAYLAKVPTGMDDVEDAIEAWRAATSKPCIHTECVARLSEGRSCRCGHYNPVRDVAIPQEEIKPCPFCGSKNVNICRTNPNACWVRCAVCEAETPSSPSRQEAIQSWNSRAATEGFAQINVDDDAAQR